MDRDEITSEGVGILKFDTSFGSDAGGDFTLPDYMPKIERILYVASTVLPEGKFLDGGVLELDGTVSYNVVYVGEDGSLTAAPLVSEYTADTAIQNASGTEGINVDTELESTTCRATGPRSLSIKSRLKIRVWSDGVLDDAGSGLDGASSGIERKCEDVSSAVRRRGGATDSVTGEMSAPEDARPVMCDGAISVNSASVVDGGVRVSGTVEVNCVFALDGTYRSAKCEMTFEGDVMIDSDEKFTSCRAWARVASVSVTPVEGVDGKFAVEAEFDLEAEAMRSETVEICTDAYSTGYETECEYRECEIPEVVAVGSKRVDVRAESDLKRPSDAVAVLDASPAVCQSAVTSSDGALYASGVVKFRVLVSSAGDIYAEEAEAPFKVQISTLPEDVPPPELQTMITCSAGGTDAKVTGGKLICSSTVTVTYSVCRLRKEKCVLSVALGERAAGEEPCVKVYYPERDESVWSVAKRYRADFARLMKNNSFDGDVAPKGKPVIII